MHYGPQSFPCRLDPTPIRASLFGEAKQWHRLERFRLRLLEKVNIEALVTATGQNLKRLLRWRGWGRRWWPGGAGGVVIPADFGLFSIVPL